MVLHYVASKGAVVAMTRAMARELGDNGIRVKGIAPGYTMSESVKANYSEDRVRANIAFRSIKREQVPDDLVGTVVFLSSGDSDSITGQTIVVDGGAVMN